MNPRLRVWRSKTILNRMEKRLKKGWRQRDATRPCKCKRFTLEGGETLSLYSAYLEYRNDIPWMSISTDRFRMLGQNEKAIDALLIAMAKRMRVSAKRLNYTNLVSWNDYKGRTQEDVLSLIEEAKNYV